MTKIIYEAEGPDVDIVLDRLLRRADATEGVENTSRNGPVQRFKRPFAVSWAPEANIVSVHPDRDANPFFHLFESLWMLAGGNDLESLLRYNSTFDKFSDDGKVITGSAYGYRWRKQFGFDQLDQIVKHLTAQPGSRRVVLSQWDSQTDLVLADTSKDVPCNTEVYLELAERRTHPHSGAPDSYTIEMMVVNRSNDLVYGMCGSNVVHFRMLQAYLAMCLTESLNTPVEIGEYIQLSKNLHVYTENVVVKRMKSMMNGELWEEKLPARFNSGQVPSIYTDPSHFNIDLGTLMNNHLRGKSMQFLTPWFETVVKPMMAAWSLWKDEKDPMRALMLLRAYDSAWTHAGALWMSRRLGKKPKAAHTSEENQQEVV